MACLTSPEVAALAAKQLNRNTLRAVVAPACLAAVADGAWHTYSLHNIHIYKFLGKRSAFHTYKQGFSRAVRASRSEFRFYNAAFPLDMALCRHTDFTFSITLSEMLLSFSFTATVPCFLMASMIAAAWTECL